MSPPPVHRYVIEGYQRLHGRTDCYEVYQDVRSGKSYIVVWESDADPSRLPSKEKTTRVVHDNGTVDYLADPEKSTDLRWRGALGRFLAKEVLKHDGFDLIDPDQCVLWPFPKGYQLYTHLKGPKEDPRRDEYLKGSAWVSDFRSPAEFMLHLKWLATGKPMSGTSVRARPDCECTYCSGTPQSEISSLYAHYHNSRRRSKTRQRGITDRHVDDWSTQDIIKKAKDYSRLPDDSR